MNHCVRRLGMETLESRLPFDAEIAGLVTRDVFVDHSLPTVEAPVGFDGDSFWVDAVTRDVPPPSYSETSVSIFVRATDDEGNELDEVDVGQEFWVELSAQGNRVHEQGVYDARFKVELDVAVLAVLPQVEPLSGYVNAKAQRRTPTGFSELGGFSSSFTPLGPDAHSVVRFKVQATGPGNAFINVSNAAIEHWPFLVYGDDLPVDPKNVLPASLILKISEPSFVSSLDPSTDNAPSSLPSTGGGLDVAPYLGSSDSLDVFTHQTRFDRLSGENMEQPQPRSSAAITHSEPSDDIPVVDASPRFNPNSDSEHDGAIDMSLEPDTDEPLLIERPLPK